MSSIRKLILSSVVFTWSLLLVPSSPLYGAQEPFTVYVKSLSSDTLTIDLTQNSQSVTLVGILKSAKTLESDDLQCEGIDQPKSRTMTISALGNDFYRAVCTLKFDKATAPIRGLSEVGLGVSDDNSNLAWQMAPLNAKLAIPQNGKDAFGIERTENILMFGYPGNTLYFAAPIAISPPSDYKSPSFASGQNGFLIFDLADVPASNPQVLIAKNKKTMSLKCPIPSTKVSSQVKKQTQVSFWINNKLLNPQRMLGTWFDPSVYSNVIIDKELKGKNAKVFCATKYVIPESNVVMAYTESTEASIKFPK
ncbi:MAG: hypothetical protein F2777_03445 [Actinobacteria bacterium]|nr:hypothetical protein [Actinomycetota bacterium]